MPVDIVNGESVSVGLLKKKKSAMQLYNGD